MAYLGKTPSQAVRSRYYFTASGSETSISPTEVSGLTFTDAAYVDVSLNGVALVSGTDYTATPSTNTISGLTALTASDVVEIVVYDTFSVFSGNVTGDFNVDGTLTANFEGTNTFTAKNTEGSTITKGTPVYIKGYSGNDSEVGIADANDSAKMPAFGLAEEDITNNSKGRIASYGNLKTIDTSAYSVGDELYVSNTGTLTATRPTGTADAVQKVAKVIRSHAQNGQLFVMGAGRSNDIPNATSNNIQFADNAKAQFGAGNDLQVYHTGSTSYIWEQGTGDLRIRGSQVRIEDDDGSTIALFKEDAGVELRHDGTVKLESTASGIDVTGTVTADGLTSVASGTAATVTNSDVWDASHADDVLYVKVGNAQASNQGGYGGIKIGDSVSSTKAVGVYARSAGTYSNTVNMDLYSGSASVYRRRATIGEDTILYGSDGTTQGFYWDGSTQRLGLGTTAPASNLHVKGNNAEIRLEDSAVANATWRLLGSTGGTTKLFRIYDSTNSADRLVIDGSGNVGIGTSSPSLPLHINGSSAGDGLVYSRSGTEYFRIDDTGTDMNIKTTGGGNTINFSTAGTERLRINANGITAISEGGTANKIDLRQGSSKVWASVDTLGTFVVRDSYNTSSVTDTNVGRHTVNINNDMNNPNYAVSGASSDLSGGSTDGFTHIYREGTGSYTYRLVRAAWYDANQNMSIGHGDLA